MSLKAISEKLGVSKTTVSLALRDHPKISIARRQQIKQLAEEMNYRPDVAARVLQGKRTASIGLIWSMSGPHPVMELVRSFTARLQSRGYIPLIIDSLGDPTVIEDTLSDLLARKVDAVLCHWRWHRLPVSIRSRLESFPSSAVVSPFPFRFTKTHLVLHDLYDAIHQVAEHFVATGHRSPGLLMHGGMIDDKVSTFSEVFRRHGIDVPRDHLLVVPVDPAANLSHSLVEQTLTLLESRFGACGGSGGKVRGGFPFDCVLCRSDEAAFALMSWLRRRGIRVPEDVAVVGMSDSGFSLASDPPLASVSHREREVIPTCLDLMMADLDGHSGGAQVKRLPRSFIARRSAG